MSAQPTHEHSPLHRLSPTTCLLAAAQKKNIFLDVGDEPTAADVAVAVWLTDPKLLEEQHAETFALRPRSFEYYSGAVGQKREFPAYNDKLLPAVGSRLDIRFVEMKRGAGSKVFVFPHRDKLYVVIRHGATMRREGKVTQDGERGVAYFRPEMHDVLVYDRIADAIGLRADTKGERTLYRDVFGEMLFGARTYFSKPFKFNLDPLRDLGPAILACDTVPGLKKMVLVEVRRYLGGEFKYQQIDRATDLFKAYGENWRRRLKNTVSATFEATLASGPTERKRRVTITWPNAAKYDRDDDADTVEAWLKLQGFMPAA